MEGLLNNFGGKILYDGSGWYSGVLARGRVVIHTPEAVRKRDNKEIHEREQGNNSQQNCETKYGVIVTTTIETTGGKTPRQQAYDASFVAGVMSDYVRLSPFGQFAQALTAKDFSTGANLSEFEIAANIIGGAADMMSFGRASSIKGYIVDQCADKLEEKVLDVLTEQLGTDAQATVKLVWSLSKLAKNVSLDKNQITSIQNNLVTALKAGKSVTDFVSDLSKQYNVDLNVDYGSVDEAVASQAADVAQPISNFKKNKDGSFDKTDN